MNTSKVRIGTVAGVLALPLIAVLAMVMFFSFSQSGPKQAEAVSGGVTMELKLPANVEVNTPFTITVSGTTPGVTIAAFGLNVITPAAVKYNGSDDCASEVKLERKDGVPLAFCSSGTSANGGHAIAVLTEFDLPAANLNNTPGERAVLANLSYVCNTEGTHTIELNASPPDADGAQFGGTDGVAITVKTANGLADSTTIDCVPPAETINITVRDSNVASLALTSSCWRISYDRASPVANVEADVVGDNGKVCAGATGKFSDSNAAVGDIEVEISGKQLSANGTDWHAQQTQTQAKYTLDNTKNACDLSAGKCSVNVTNVLKQGVANIQVNNNVTGGKLLELVCFNITDAAGAVTNVCTSTGSLSQNLDLGSYTIELKDTKLAASSLQLAAGADDTLDCDLAKATIAERTCDVKFSFEGQKVFHLKSPSLSNLFLTNQQGQAKNGLDVEVGTTIAPQTCRAGTDVALFTNNLSLAPGSPSPKDLTVTQRVAAFEMEVRYDPQWVCVNIVPGDYWFLQANKTNPFTGNVRAAAQAIADSAPPVAGGKAPISLSTGAGGVVCFIDDKNDGQQPTGLARIGCVITNKDVKDIDQTLPLAYVLVKPQPEVYNQIIPNQENGIVTMILNSGCNLADLQGHDIDSSGCDDSVLTIRWLEADFDGNCVVNVLDTQAVSLRWGASVGSLLYNARMDTMPYGNIKGDGLINIKDVQFAYGRTGSECSEQNRFKLAGTPNPAQNPVDNK